jgi:hypothetical protein
VFTLTFWLKKICVYGFINLRSHLSIPFN